MQKILNFSKYVLLSYSKRTSIDFMQLSCANISKITKPENPVKDKPSKAHPSKDKPHKEKPSKEKPVKQGKPDAEKDKPVKK